MCRYDDGTCVEEWRDVVGYEGFYQVSSIGRVRSVDRHIETRGGAKLCAKGRILRQSMSRAYYPLVSLCRDGHSKSVRVHRLVAEAFIPNPSNLPIVDHINRVRSDNRVENIRWATVEENYLNKSDDYDLPLEEIFECFRRVAEDMSPSSVDGEEFRAIDGYDYDYYVSNFGRVIRGEDRSIDKNGRVTVRTSSELVVTTRPNGLNTVNLNKDGSVTRTAVDVLVAKAFVDNPDGHDFVRHIDGDRSNDFAENLRWINSGCMKHTTGDTSELWVDIAGYEGVYQISNRGNVRSLDRYIPTKGCVRRLVPGKVMKPEIDECGRRSVGLISNGVYSRKMLSRLVAEAFIPNPDGLPSVEHLNGVSGDDRVENLRWATNRQDAVTVSNVNALDLDEIAASLSDANLMTSGKMALCKPIVRDDGVVYGGVRAAARAMGCATSGITANIRGKCRSCHGHTFKYLFEEDNPPERAILQIDVSTGDVIGRFDTLRSAAAAVDNYSIHQCLLGRYSTVAGYKWAYEE